MKCLMSENREDDVWKKFGDVYMDFHHCAGVGPWESSALSQCFCSLYFGFSA